MDIRGVRFEHFIVYYRSYFTKTCLYRVLTSLNIDIKNISFIWASSITTSIVDKVISFKRVVFLQKQEIIKVKEKLVLAKRFISLYMYTPELEFKSSYSENKFSELSTGVKPMTFQIPTGRSNH